MVTSLLRIALRRTPLIAASWFLFCLSATPASGQQAPIVIKMASMAPANSEWHFALQVMGQRWREASDGQVVLQIIPSAQGGEEVDVLNKMRFGQFQAGGFTLAGLENLTPACVVLAIPMLAEDQEGLHRIRAGLGPKLEELFLEEGFVTLHWVDLGWMRFFTPEPDPSPDAVRSYKYVQWGGDSLSHIWRAAGFKPGIRLTMADITNGLRTGLVEAINTAPLVVAGYSWFSHLDYMIDLRWAPLSGATLVDRDTWERIPEELRPVLKQIAEETGEAVRAELTDWEREAIEGMEGQGLKVIPIPPEIRAEWDKVFDKSWELLRGDVIPEAWFEEAVRLGREGGVR